MRFARPQALRGRRDEASDGPALEHADLLDGTLWLAVPGTSGSWALRATGSDVLIALPSLAHPQPGYVSTRTDLRGLIDPTTAYDVVLVPSDGRAPLPARADPWARPPPPGPDQVGLVRTDDDTLRIGPGTGTPAVALRAIEALPEGARITVAEPRPTLALLDDEGAVVASYPTEQSGAGSRAVITPEMLPPLHLRTRVVVGEPGSWLPVRRRNNCLVEPTSGAPLPSLVDPESGEPRARLRWSPDALLIVRLLDPTVDQPGGGRG